jgi:glycosyltransferase involved in cell wall biosynthesis
MISVITVVKDDAIGLSETYNSILSQSLTDWEMIIIASPSSDLTLEVAYSLSHEEKRVSVFIQEPLGIYEAMNYGLDKIEGRYVWFLNAGDRFASNNVLEDALAQTSKYGSDLLIGGYLTTVDLKTRRYKFRAKKITRFRFGFNLRMSHQSMLFSSKIFQSGKRYDLNYRYAADFDLILSLFPDHIVRTTNVIYSIFRSGGAADQNIFKVHKEKHNSRMSHMTKPIVYPLSKIWSLTAKLKIFLRTKVN